MTETTPTFLAAALKVYPKDRRAAAALARLLEQRHSGPGVRVDVGDDGITVHCEAPPAGLEEGWERIGA
jgi:hypothetical protein